MVMILVNKWVGVLPRDTGKNAHQNFSFKGVQIFPYQYNDHKTTVFANNSGDKYCITSHMYAFPSFSK